MKLFAALLVSALTLSAQAGILKQEAGDKKIEGVSIAKSAVVSQNGQDIALAPIGAGLRSKKVLIANVKVYVAQLLSSDASKFIRTDAGALASLNDSRTTAMSFTFLRTVDAPTVQQSFKDALKANGVDTKEAAAAALLTAVNNGGDAVQGKNMTFIIQKNADGTETVTYEDPKEEATSIQGPAGFGTQVLSMWLGKSTDSGVGALKAQIIKGN